MFALGKSKRWSEAEAPLKRAIQLKPDYAEAHSNLGWVYNNLGRFAEAVPPLKKAIELDPKMPEAHFNLGLTFSKWKQTETVVAEMQKNDAVAEFKIATELTGGPRRQHSILLRSLGNGKKQSGSQEASVLKSDYSGAISSWLCLLNSGDKKKPSDYKILKPSTSAWRINLVCNPPYAPPSSYIYLQHTISSFGRRRARFRVGAC